MLIDQHILRPLNIAGGVLLTITGLIHISANLSYTKTVVAIYLSLFSVLIWSTSLVPSLVTEHYSALFPFLKHNTEKGVFTLLVSFLCFGSEFGLFGTLSGITLLLSGAGHLAMGLFGFPQEQIIESSPKPSDMQYEPPDLISPSS